MIVSRSQTGTFGCSGPPRACSTPKPMNVPTMNDVAVREVQELEDAVDERVPERDQRVDAAERESVDGELDEGVHVGSQAQPRAARCSGRPRTLLPV